MIDQAEYERRYYGRVYGKRRAVVVDNQDPERRGRVKVENSELYGASQSPWAMPCYPFYGGRDCGFFAVPPVGSLVWIECEEGLSDFPIYSGGYFDNTNDGHISDSSPIESSIEFQTEPSTVPAHGRGDYDGSDFGSLKGGYGVPSTSYEADYGEVTILQTKTGHKLEFDDTEGGERIQIHHSKGAHIEILPDGSVNIVTDGKILTRSSHREEVVVNTRKEVVGSHSEIVEGNHTKNVYGDSNSTVNGVTNLNLGSLNSNVEKSINLTGSVLKSSFNNLFEVNTGGDLNFSAFGDTEIVGASKGYISFSNAVTVPTGVYVENSLNIQGLNGNVTLSSADLAGIHRFGISSRGGLPALAGGQVFVGNLSSETISLGVGGIPLLKEPAVLGTQLQLFMETILTILDTFFGLTNTGGVTPGFGGPNPILAVASTTAQIALTTAKTVFLSSPQPLILSNCVYLSKE